MLWMFACTDGGGSVGDPAARGVGDLEIAETDSPSVFVASWETESAATVRLEYGEDGVYDHQIAASATGDGRSHAITLAGLAGGYTWNVRTVSVIDGEEITGTPVTIDVPGPPDRLMDAVVDDAAPERGGFFIACMPFPGDNIVGILDRRGRPVWWYTDTSRGELLQCRATPDATGVEFLVMGYSARFARVSLTNEVEVDAPMRDLHHSFVRQQDDGYLALVHDARDVGATQVVGDAVIRTDASFREEGQVWSTWDTLTPPEPFGPSMDWTHANELWLNDDEDKLLVSLHELSTIVQLDLPSGEVDWQLGGDDSDFTLPEDGVFQQQHGVRQVDGGLLIFDNGALQDDLLDSHSRVLELAMDEASMTTRVVRSYEPEDGLYVSMLGNADPGPDGVVTVFWGVGGRLNELSPTEDGYDVLYQLDMGLGAPFAYGHRLDSLAGATW